MRLLLIEDDEQLGDAVKTGLRHSGYIVDWVTNGEQADAAIRSNLFECILLDLSLPKRTGLSVLNQMRHSGNLTPVIILTAQDSLECKIKSLDSGADDYIVKPFDLNELCARIRALSRRHLKQAESLLKYQNITLDPKSHQVTLDNKPLIIPRREFALLQKLLEHPGQVLTREQLMQSLYSWEDEVESNALEVHIHNLRKKLHTKNIRTLRGIGYMLTKEDPS